MKMQTDSERLALAADAAYQVYVSDLAADVATDIKNYNAHLIAASMISFDKLANSVTFSAQ